jgi:putative radical SAM enzyme (TIGR03279 family)
LSERLQLKTKGLVVERVEPDSPAGRAGFVPHDVLRSVNGEEVNDIIDLRYLSSEEEFDVEFVRDGMYQTVQMEREWGEELGFTFSFELADQIHTCDNKCVFCFIHQMPKGMRKSLYLMDDDFRLSFLHGNYVTLTNMSEEEFERTKQQGLSPLYVSVHATDPSLRGFMLGRGAPEPILPRLADLAAHRIDVHCQVVLCPGLNDGASLERTVQDLAALHTERSGASAGVLSVAVVPVGLSKYRHNLYPVQQVTQEYAKAFLDRATGWRKAFLNEIGTRFVFPTDEWYFYAGVSVPPRKEYEDFPQFEDGVGTCRLFLDQAARAYPRMPSAIAEPVQLTLVTGALPARVIEALADRLNLIGNLSVDVCVVTNHFFGHGITIAGLLTGQDVIAHLANHRPRGIVALPDITLKDSHLFLDNHTIENVREATGCDVRACPSRAKEFLRDWLPAHVFRRSSRN